MRYDLIIIGAGPAGMTAALYALRAEKSVLLLDSAGYGGQITLSDCVENYPGIANVNGYDLAEGMMAQLRALNVKLENANVTGVEPDGDGYRVLTASDSYEARAVILATGVTHRKLGVPGEEKFLGRGVSFCAVCDGGFFRKKEVAVIGGGNTAVQDALYLAEFCQRVYLIHRREGFRAEERLLEKARNHPNIEFLTNTVVLEMRGEMRLASLLLKNTATDEEHELAVAGAFEAIGSIPQNAAFDQLVPVDGEGYFAVGDDCVTSQKGIFVAGDCRAKKVRQLTTATADGTVAALAAIDYLDGIVQ
ncbi:MAG: thioredoxin-disulfide reductase [Ruminococcaceae bacterium]|nr:thioredoxin-disulfide reductase [Oscillospiraceae bacterium]